MTLSQSSLIVAIDGPSGAGKSTVARTVAQKLNYTYIDTGAMYRCVGLAATQAGLDCRNGPALQALLEKVEISFEGPALDQKVRLNGRDVTSAIRDHAASKAASDFSALPQVRQRLVALQRLMGKDGGVVMEGRDIGTNVFPEAKAKIYLDASPEVRAKRRYNELQSKGKPVDYEQILADQMQRDRNDAARAHNPLRQAADAVRVDTSDMTLEQVVETVCNIVKKKH